MTIFSSVGGEEWGVTPERASRCAVPTYRIGKVLSCRVTIPTTAPPPSETQDGDFWV